MKKITLLAIICIAALLISGCGAVPTIINVIPDLVEQAVLLQQEPTPEPEQGLPSRYDNAIEALQDRFIEVYDAVSPSVVNLRVEKSPAAPSIQVPAFPFNFPSPEQAPEFQQESLGSGFVWDKNGHIITNNHVIEGAEEIIVTFHDGTQVDARLVGADPDSDLAAVKVELPANRLKPIEVADSTRIEVGQFAVAIGNPFGLQGTMTTGIISALGRSLPINVQTSTGSRYSIPDVIQTDAPINPGNSGGVLVDLEGQLIGVPTAIESPVRANAGVGFVVPSVIVEKVVPSLIERGFYEHPWIGISGTTLSPLWADELDLDRDQRGALVIDVIPDSPAADGGLIGSDRLVTIDEQEVRLGGDLIIAVNEAPVLDFEDLTAYLARYTEVGQTVTLTVIRDGDEMTVDITLKARPGRETADPGEEAGANGTTWLGILGTELTPELAEAMDLPGNTQGVLIQEVVNKGPAEKAGLRGNFMSTIINGQQVLVGGDVITALDGMPVSTMNALQAAIRTHRPGDPVEITILRQGEEIVVEVKLGERPASQ